MNWGVIQDGLAATLGEIGMRNRDVAILREAVSASRASLEFAGRQSNQNLYIGWSNLGITLQKLGECATDPVPLNEAVACLTKSLSLTDKAADPVNWKTWHMNLGWALRWLGTITKDTETLHQAREAYVESHSQDCREEAPMNWAMNQWNTPT